MNLGCQAFVTMDYVQNGDLPVPEGEWKGKKRAADERVLMTLIQHRYSHVFESKTSVMTPREIEAVYIFPSQAFLGFFRCRGQSDLEFCAFLAGCCFLFKDFECFGVGGRLRSW